MTTLKERLLTADIGLTESDFHSYCTDLLVIDRDGKVYKWLQENYDFPKAVTKFRGEKDSGWDNLPCLEIPFASPRSPLVKPHFKPKDQ